MGIKRKKITGKTPSEMLEILNIYKEVISMPISSFVTFINNIPQDLDQEYIIKVVKGNILIGSIEKKEEV